MIFFSPKSANAFGSYLRPIFNSVTFITTIIHRCLRMRRPFYDASRSEMNCNPFCVASRRILSSRCFHYWPINNGKSVTSNFAFAPLRLAPLSLRNVAKVWHRPGCIHTFYQMDAEYNHYTAIASAGKYSCASAQCMPYFMCRAGISRRSVPSSAFLSQQFFKWGQQTCISEE